MFTSCETCLRQRRSGVAVGISMGLAALFLCMSLLLIFSVSADAAEEMFETGYRRLVIYSEGEKVSWVLGEAYSQAGLSSQALGLNWRVVIKQSMPDGDLRRRMDPASTQSSGLIGNEENGRLTGRIFFQERYSQVRLELGNADQSVTLTTQLRYKSGNRTEQWVGVSFRPSGWIKGELTKSKEHPLPSYSVLRYEYLTSDQSAQFEGGRFDWHAPAEVTRLHLVFAPTGEFRVESIIHEANFRPQDPEPQGFLSGEYSGVLEGLWQDDIWRAGYRHPSGWDYTVDYRRSRLNSRLRLYDSGYRFGYFGIVKLLARQWSVQAERGSKFIRFYRGDATGKLLGSVEAWPFLKGLLRFLGERRHFVAEGDLKWYYLSSGTRLRLWKRLHLDGAVNLLHLETDIRQVNWRPILGIGFDDLRSDRVDIKRASLIRLKIEPTYRWKRFQLQLSMSQWAPLSFQKYSDDVDPLSGTQVPGEEEGGGDSVWGGFDAQLKLQIPF